MFYFNIHNFVGLVLNGKGFLYDYLSFQFNYFQSGKELSGKSSISINIKEVSKTEVVSELKGDNCNFLKLKNESFVWQINNSGCSLAGNKPLLNQYSVDFDAHFQKMKTNAIIDLLLRVRLINHGLFLVHASCIEKEKGAILMPAWKSVGKTAACLKLIERGCNFLGDDKVWVSSDGKVYAYPRYIVIKDTNALQFPSFVNKKTKLKLFLRSKIVKNSFFIRNKYVNHLFKKMLNVPVSYHYIEDLYPGTKVSDQAPLVRIVNLSKCNQSSTDINPMNFLQTQTNIRNISDVEWNYDLFRLATAHDVLFPEGPNWKEELSRLLSEEERLMNDSFSMIDCYEAQFPLKTEKIDWDKFTEETITFNK